MRGSDCTCRYWINSPESYRTTTLIMLMLTPDQRRAMAPADCIYYVDTSLGVKTSMGLIKWTVSFRVLLISVGVMLTQRPPLLKLAWF